MKLGDGAGASNGAWRVYIFAPMVYSATHARKHAMANAAHSLGCHAVYVEPPNSHSPYAGPGCRPCLNVAGTVSPSPDGPDVLAVPKKWCFGPLRLGVGRACMEQVQGRWLADALGRLAEPGVRTLALVTTARWEPLIRDISFDALVYDKNDEPDVLKGWLSVGDYLKRESALIGRAALLISPSQALLSAGLRARPDVPAAVIRNGVEWEFFASHRDEPAPELGADRRPLVGFVGTLGPWIDVDLLAAAARENTDYRFVVIGPVSSAVDTALLRAQPNVSLLGAVPFERVPAIMNRMDVCLIPFKDGPISTSACPVKFFEYLSLGKPIVCTPMPELADFGDLFYMTRDGFAQAIRSAVQERDPALTTRRAAAGQHFRWDRLFQRVLDALAATRESSAPSDAL